MQTPMSRVGSESTIPEFEQAKTFHALDRVATVIGRWTCYSTLFQERLPIFQGSVIITLEGIKYLLESPVDSHEFINEYLRREVLKHYDHGNLLSVNLLSLRIQLISICASLCNVILVFILSI
jgi:hypothetical protein